VSTDTLLDDCAVLPANLQSQGKVSQQLYSYATIAIVKSADAMIFTQCRLDHFQCRQNHYA